MNRTPVDDARAAKSFSVVRILASSLLGALILALISPMPVANAVTFNCGTSGTYTVSGGVASGGANCVGNVTFDASVTSIASNAIERAQLGAVVFSSGITSVGQYAFYLSSMTSLTLNSSFRTIGTAAFVGNGLTSITLPSGITTLSPYAFQGQPFTSLTIPSSVTSIGNYAFSGAVLTNLVIPTSVTSIGEGAFWNVNVKSIMFLSGLRTIGNFAFYASPFEVLTLPSTVTSIGTDAFKSAALTCFVNGSSASLLNTGLAGFSAQSSCTSQSITVSASVTSAAFNGSSYAAIPSLSTTSGSGSGAVTYSISSGGTATGCALSSSAANATLTANTTGTCIIKATKAGDANYASATSTLTFTFTKSVVTTSLTLPASPVTYGTPVVETATLSSESATGTISFSSNGLVIGGCSSVAVNRGVAVCSSWRPEVGTYSSLIATYSGDSAFETSTSTAGTLQVNKATLNVIPDAKNVVFGSIASTYSFTYQGFAYSDSASSASFTAGLIAPVCANSDYSISTSVSASPLMISCIGGSSTNYSFNTSSTANLTIGKATPSVSVALSAATPTYGAVDTITAVAFIPGFITFKSSGIDIAGCINTLTTLISPYTAECMWVPNGITSYSLTATLDPTNSVDFLTANASALTPTSTRAAITVTPTAGQSKVYGANNPPITYSITSGVLVGSDALTGALTFTGTNVGSYSIDIGTLANPNYTITLASETFAITKAAQTVVTLSSLSSAYNPSNKTVTLTGSGGSGTGTYSYALDTSNVTPGCSVSRSTLTFTTAGTCIIAVTHLSDANYLSRTDTVSFSIGLASQSINFASLSAKSYSSETFTVSATSSASLTVAFTSGSPTICTTSGSNGSTITLLGVGTCVINANQLGDSNTSAASQVSQNFTVNPRAVTITADAKTKIFGATDPALTYNVSSGSLILGDILTGVLTRAIGSDAGDYQILQGTLSNANNPKYDITFVSALLVVTRATPSLLLTYPNSNLAILRPGATDTPTVTTSSSAGALTFTSSTASSICTVDSSSGVISLFGAGSCSVVMATAQTTNFIQHFETTTVTVALLSTSLVGIDQSKLVSMGQPFYAHASIDQSYSFSSGSNGASVAIPAGALDSTVPISISLLTDSSSQRAIISSDGTSVLSVVVSWVASDGSVPSTNSGKAISVTLTNASIKSGAKIYSIIGNQSQLLGTAQVDGSVTTLITDDPVLLVINPVVTPPPSSEGGNAVVIQGDNSAALALAKIAAEAKAREEEKAAAALKAAKEKMEADAKALDAAKAVEDAAALKAAQEAADASAREAALLQATKDAEIAAANAAKAVRPQVTLYSVSPTLKLSAYDSAYLARYVKSLKNGASVTCIGYTYGKIPASKASQALAKRQATAVCAQMTKINKSLKTSISIVPVSKAPKSAIGAKWVGVSFRIDGFKTKP